jgi:hypothetical protein
VRREHPHGRQADGPALEQLQDQREASCRSRHRDPVEGLLLRETERLPAVGEERAVASLEVHLAGVELRQVGDEQGRRAPLAHGQLADATLELGVGEPAKRREEIRAHVSSYRTRRSAEVRRAGIRQSGEMPRPASGSHGTTEGIATAGRTSVRGES